MKTFDELVSTLEKEPPFPCDLKVGDTVTFTNDYGVSFHGLKVTGFAKKEDCEYGRFIFLNTSCYWFPKTLEQVTLEKRK